MRRRGSSTRAAATPATATLLLLAATGCAARPARKSLTGQRGSIAAINRTYSRRFVTTVRTNDPDSEAAGSCSDVRYDRIERLALALSLDLMATSKHYKVHSWGGIFAQGGAGGAGEANAFDYRQAKSRFIFRRLCSEATRVKTVCEVGFMAGHTAMLFLETIPHARVVSFDLGAVGLVPWLATQERRLREAYGKRWLGVVKGDSRKTLPEYHTSHPSFRCDAVFVDGGKTAELRYNDYVNLRAMSSDGALVFFDEATSLGCVNGSAADESACGLDGDGRKVHDRSTVRSAMGTYRASREGILAVEACEWPPGFSQMDGVCAARFGRRLADRAESGGGAGAEDVSVKREAAEGGDGEIGVRPAKLPPYLPRDERGFRRARHVYPAA